jgi:hypothetical protein
LEFFRRLIGKRPLEIRASQECLLDLEGSLVPMKRVYLLSEELRQDSQRVELARVLTQDKTRPHMGLRGSHGLFASAKWWSSINRGTMPLRFTKGVIVSVYEAGMDHEGVDNAFDLLLDDGNTYCESIYVNDPADANLFKKGCLVHVVYALDKLKRTGGDGRSHAEIVLEMAISLEPVRRPADDAA